MVYNCRAQHCYLWGRHQPTPWPSLTAPRAPCPSPGGLIFCDKHLLSTWSLPIPRPGSDGSYAGDNYFQYINVPAHKTFEWGYRRGNPDHNREEYLSQKDHTFKAKVNFWQNLSTLSIYCNCILSAEMARFVRWSRRALLRLQPRWRLQGASPRASLRSPGTRLLRGLRT